MHGRSLAWVRDRCQVEGAGRALLYAIAAFADKHEGACTASYRTLARAAGMKPRWTVEMLRRFVDQGLVERLDPGAGRRPATHRIHPSLWRSGAVDAPQEDAVVVHSTTRSGAVPGSVVVQSPIRSGAVPSSLTSQNGSQEKYVEEKSLEDSALRVISPSRADHTGSAGRADARPRQPQPSVVVGEADPRPLTAKDRAGGWANPDGEIDHEQFRRSNAAADYLERLGAVWYDQEPFGYFFPHGLDGEFPPGYLIPSRPSDLTWIRWAEERQAKSNPSPERDRYLADLLREVEEIDGEWEGTAIRLSNGHLIDTVAAAKAFLASHPRGDR